MLNIINTYLHKAPTVDEIVNLIRTTGETPTTERLDILKDELIKLTQKAKKIITGQDAEHKKVLTIDPLSNDKKDDIEWFVIGDIHGDFQTLSRILMKIYLRPKIDPAKIKIIFLGDYIDRGARPLEVLKLLFSLKARWPEHFWLIRGNHECLKIGDDGCTTSTVAQSDTISFWKEYFGEEVFRELALLFDALPVVLMQPLKPCKKQEFEEAKKIMYVHGGIPRTEHLDLPLGSPECWNEFCWSDPELEKEDVFNGPGNRFSFAMKDFLAFTIRHNITLIIRGHEVRKDGFDLHEKISGTGRRIITIHSCGGTDNPDSYYGSEILVPRFLNVGLDRTSELPISVEEAYRDDILFYGGLKEQDQALYQQILKGVENRLKNDAQITFNLTERKMGSLDDSSSKDPSNAYDSGHFMIIIGLEYIEMKKKLKFMISMYNFDKNGVIDIHEGWNVDEAINIISDEVLKVYPIFGKLPQQLLNDERSTLCQKSDPRDQ